MVSSVLDEETVSTLPTEPQNVTVLLLPQELHVTFSLLRLQLALTVDSSVLETVFVSMEPVNVLLNHLWTSKERLATLLSSLPLLPVKISPLLEIALLVWHDLKLLVSDVPGALTQISLTLRIISLKVLVLKITNVVTCPSTLVFLLKTSLLAHALMSVTQRIQPLNLESVLTSPSVNSSNLNLEANGLTRAKTPLKPTHVHSPT
jgi:hypothetical protein